MNKYILYEISWKVLHITENIYFMITILFCSFAGWYSEGERVPLSIITVVLNLLELWTGTIFMLLFADH